MTEKIPIFSIGYGSRSIEELIALLQQYEIAYLLDIRSKPYSKFKPEFSKAAFEKAINQAGIKYVFMGDSIGGQPDLPSTRTPDGRVDYDKLREKDFFIAGIQRLKEAWNKQLRVAIMCSEGKPEMCHRSKLIGVSLEKEGVEIVHIDENGKLVDQKHVLLRLEKNAAMDPLFDLTQYGGYTSRKSYKLDEEDE